MPRPMKGNGRYMPGLDGLRAVAVLAVIAYHLNLSWAPGGLLGVGVFFVLSGYLITDLLLTQWKQHGHLNLKDFWVRRARRLLPALILMLGLVVAWLLVFDTPRLTAMSGDVIAALLYVSNWWFVFHHVSYFASFGPPSPLGHLWSLAVEEQFYLVWPLLLAIGIRFAPRRGKLAGWTLGLALVSALLMAVLYQPGSDPNRVYYGTDTRAFGLLIGAALAMVWPSRQLPVSTSAGARMLLDVVGGASFVGILYMIWSTNEYQTFLYRGGLVLVSVLTAVTVAVAAHPDSRFALMLGWKPLRWLGVRSYGIYLWHYPVILLSSPSVNTNGLNVPLAVLQVVTSVVLAALSWRYLEEPIRTGAAARFLAQTLTNGRRRSRFALSAFAVLLVGLCGFGLTGPVRALTASTNTVGGGSGNLQTMTQQETAPAGTASSGDRGGVGADDSSSDKASAEHTPSNDAGSSPVGAAKVSPKSGEGVTAIGDSVLLDAAPYLKKQLPGMVIDAKVGRQITEVPSVVEQLKAQGKLGSVVILEMGNNGPFTQEQLTNILNSMGAKEVILVNTRVPRPWQTVVNQTLKDVAGTYPHSRLVDWFDASAGQDAYFYGDGVHLNDSGSKAYASLLVQAVEQSENKR